MPTNAEITILSQQRNQVLWCKSPIWKRARTTMAFSHIFCYTPIRLVQDFFLPILVLLLSSLLPSFLCRLFWYFCVLIWCSFSWNKKDPQLMCCCCCSRCSSLIKWHYMSANKYISWLSFRGQLHGPEHSSIFVKMVAWHTVAYSDRLRTTIYVHGIIYWFTHSVCLRKSTSFKIHILKDNRFQQMKFHFTCSKKS